jgi:hypothetical protein
MRGRFSLPHFGGLRSGAGRVARRVGSMGSPRPVDRLFLIPSGPRTGARTCTWLGLAAGGLGLDYS